MTIFMMKNERRGFTTFMAVSREVYKRIARSENQRGRGGDARFETEYRDGVPVKMMTLLVRRNS